MTHREQLRLIETFGTTKGDARFEVHNPLVLDPRSGKPVTLAACSTREAAEAALRLLRA